LSVKKFVRITEAHDEQIASLRAQVKELKTDADAMRHIFDHFFNKCTCREGAESEMQELKDRTKKAIAEALYWKSMYDKTLTKAIMDEYKEAGGES